MVPQKLPGNDPETKKPPVGWEALVCLPGLLRLSRPNRKSPANNDEDDNNQEDVQA